MRRIAGQRSGRLKPEHIDSERMLIKVVQGKGGKDAIRCFHPTAGGTARLLPKIPAENLPVPSSFKTRQDRPLSYESLRASMKRPERKPGSTRRRPFTPCAIALPPICWKPATISAKSRS